MRYRALTSDGDSSFCSGSAPFLVNSPACVAQLVETRLRLVSGEWFLDRTEGTPYGTQIQGAGTAPFRDNAIRQRILNTTGVTGIASYSSSLDPVTREFTVSVTIDTLYGQFSLQMPLP